MRLLLRYFHAFTLIYFYSVPQYTEGNDSHPSNTVRPANAEGQLLDCFFIACPSLVLFLLSILRVLIDR